MEVIKIVIIALTGMIISCLLKDRADTLAKMSGFAVIIIISMCAMSKMSVIIEGIEYFINGTKINIQYISMLIKMVGITYVTEIGSNLCRDGGCLAIANIVEIFGKITIISLGTGVVVTLSNVLLEIL